MNETEEEETSLFLKKEVLSSVSGDDWDDSKLIKAYDKAINKAKKQILKNVQGEYGLSNEDVQDILSDFSSSKGKSRSGKSKKKKKRWEVGNACRAIYSEDGEEYEAKIISIIDDWCTVKFFGYNNKENVLLKDLLPSLGKSVIKIQKETAKNDAELGGLCIDDEREEESSKPGYGFEFPHPENAYLPKAAGSNRVGQRRVVSSPYQTFPPPPIPPPLFSTFGKTKAGLSIPRLPTGSDTHSSMMLSWYMCGYYTGYYHRDLADQQH